MKLQYYDAFSYVYDFFTGPAHRKHRVDAVGRLQLKPGQTVLDMPCGTGANFPLLTSGVGDKGHVVGCDFSPGMLAQARKRIRKSRWTNVHLVECDARKVERDELDVATIDAVICMLGLTVIPDWEAVFERTFDMLEPGGRYVAMDLFLDGKATSRFANWFFGVVASADSTRRFWEPLEVRGIDYEVREFPFFGGKALVAAGTKPLEIVAVVARVDRV